MYGLKADVDLSFRMGKELIQVAVGPADVQFNLHESVSLSVQSRVEHSSKGSVKVWEGDENEPISACSLLALIGSSVVSVQGDPDGTLTLEFSNGDFVKVFDTEGYEAYQICNGDQRIYV